MPPSSLCPTGVAMPPKRGRAAADETAQEFRRHKSATEEAFAELVCPITFSLPVDPVTAEDGNVYERSAIEEWLKQQHKSPVTNLAMGTRLLPALQVKNMIRTMVASGALTGDKVDAWKLKLEEEKGESSSAAQQVDPKAIAEAIVAGARAAAARVAAARQAFLDIEPWICGKCTYCHIDVSEVRFLACALCLAEKPCE